MQVRMLLVGVLLAATVAGPVGASGAQDGPRIWEGDENYGPAEFDLGGLIRFDSGYLLYGYVPEPDREGSNDLLLVRTDRTGETRWTKRINRSARDVLTALVRTDDGFVVGGDRRKAFTGETPTERPGYVMKLAGDGTVRWVTDVPGDGPGAMAAYRGGVVTTVRLDAFQTSVARVGADGEVLWNRSYSAGEMRAVARSGDHLVVAGNSRFGPSVVGTVAPDGDLTEILIEEEDANFQDVAVTTGGATYVVGQVSNETVEASVDLTVRLDPDGDEQWRRTVLPTPNGSSVRAVTLGPRGSVYVTAVGFGRESRLVHFRADGSVSREFEGAVTPAAYAPSGHLLYVSSAGIEAIEHRPGTPTPSPTPTATPTPSPTVTPTPAGTPAESETRSPTTTDGTGPGPGVATAVAALVALALAARS